MSTSSGDMLALLADELRALLLSLEATGGQPFDPQQGRALSEQCHQLATSASFLGQQEIAVRLQALEQLALSVDGWQMLNDQQEALAARLPRLAS